MVQTSRPAADRLPPFPFSGNDIRFVAGGVIPEGIEKKSDNHGGGIIAGVLNRLSDSIFLT